MPGLTIDEWGPAAWNTLHVVAHSFPHEPSDAERDDMRTFLLLFTKHLPCPSCKRHFMDLLSRRLDERALQSRFSLVAFMNDAHNEVNRRLGKRVWTLEEHYRVYRRRKYRMSPLPVVVAVGVLVATACVCRARQKNCAPKW